MKEGERGREEKSERTDQNRRKEKKMMHNSGGYTTIDKQNVSGSVPVRLRYTQTYYPTPPHPTPHLILLSLPSQAAAGSDHVAVKFTGTLHLRLGLLISLQLILISQFSPSPPQIPICRPSPRRSPRARSPPSSSPLPTPTVRYPNRNPPVSHLMIRFGRWI